MSSFASDTALERVQQGSYSGNIESGWDIGGNANGGYLLAIAARAIALETARPDPLTITAHYLSPGKAGPVTVEVKVLKQGRRFAVATATLFANSTALVQVLGTFADLGRTEPGFERIDAAPPPLPQPGECVAHVSARGAPPMFDRLDLRLHPEDAGFLCGKPSGLLRVRGWFRFAESEAVDTLGLLLAVDAFPPTAFNAHPVAWTPTVELTTHVRARPAPGWLRANFTSRFLSGGFLEEDGEIWDSSDRLVAQSRQLALLPRAQ
jgi:acyl-CoA thioesterase